MADSIPDSIEAVALLRRKNFKVLQPEDGVHDWRRRGFRVAVGERP